MNVLQKILKNQEVLMKKLETVENEGDTPEKQGSRKRSRSASPQQPNLNPEEVIREEVNPKRQQAVNKRTKEVLTDFIRKTAIGARTVVCTDSFPAYNGVKEYCRHHAVNHKEEWKTEDGVHTNHAESCHSAVKRLLRNGSMGRISDLDMRVDYATLMVNKSPGEKLQSLMLAMREARTVPEQMPEVGTAVYDLDADEAEEKAEEEAEQEATGPEHLEKALADKVRVEKRDPPQFAEGRPADWHRWFTVRGGEPYRVKIGKKCECSCPYFAHSKKRCKHIMYVLYNDYEIGKTDRLLTKNVFSAADLQHLFRNEPATIGLA